MQQGYCASEALSTMFLRELPQPAKVLRPLNHRRCIVSTPRILNGVLAEYRLGEPGTYEEMLAQINFVD